VAIIVVQDIAGGTQAMYEQVSSKVTGGRGLPESPADLPMPGLISHAAGPTPTGWVVVDVWESEEAFRRFGEKLTPAFREIGMPESDTKIYEAFHVVTR
jgi:hypothetical protein